MLEDTLDGKNYHKTRLRLISHLVPENCWRMFGIYIKIKIIFILLCLQLMSIYYSKSFYFNPCRMKIIRKFKVAA